MATSLWALMMMAAHDSIALQVGRVIEEQIETSRFHNFTGELETDVAGHNGGWRLGEGMGRVTVTAASSPKDWRRASSEGL